MVSVIREDDRKKYGMTGSNLAALERLMQAPRDNFGLAIFPEGTVKGGRKENGAIYGMQQVVEGGKLLIRCINFWIEQGLQSVLLPVGIINSYELFSPDSYHISEDILAMINGSKELKQLTNVAIGKPFTSQDIEKTLDAKNQEHIDFLMKKVANLLPEEVKGYYGKPRSAG